MEHDLSFINSFDYANNNTPETIFAEVDADSSQIDAMLCAKQSDNFVFQGPPGTDKSQLLEAFYLKILKTEECLGIIIKSKLFLLKEEGLLYGHIRNRFEIRNQKSP